MMWIRRRSLKYNHPKTEVRNEKAEEFLREWAALCDKYVHGDPGFDSAGLSEDEEEDDEPLAKDEFVVEKLLGIGYGGSGKKNDLSFKLISTRSDKLKANSCISTIDVLSIHSVKLYYLDVESIYVNVVLLGCRVYICQCCITWMSGLYM